MTRLCLTLLGILALARLPVGAEASYHPDPELERLYGEEIPVVFLEGSKLFKYHVDERRLVVHDRAQRAALPPEDLDAA